MVWGLSCRPWSYRTCFKTEKYKLGNFVCVHALVPDSRGPFRIDALMRWCRFLIPCHHFVDGVPLLNCFLCFLANLSAYDRNCWRPKPVPNDALLQAKLANFSSSPWDKFVGWPGLAPSSVLPESRTCNVHRGTLKVLHAACWDMPWSRTAWIIPVRVASQVVSVPSRRRNFPLKSLPNFRIKVTTYSQNTVWTCNRQHASRCYIVVKLVNSQFTSKQPWNYAIQVGSRPIAYTQWQRGLQPGTFTSSQNIAN